MKSSGGAFWPTGQLVLLEISVILYECCSSPGRDGTVTAACRENLPYVDAVLHEVMRIKTVAPIGLFHETSAPIELGKQ